MSSDILVLLLWTYQQIERDDLSDHQQWHVDDGDRIGSAELPWHQIKASLNGVVVVDDDVGCPHDVKGDDEGPKQRTYPCREERQNGEHTGCEVTVGGEVGEASGHIRPYDPGKDKDQPKESEAVQRSDCTVGVEPVRPLEPGPKVDVEAKQPSDITQNEMN